MTKNITIPKKFDSYEATAFAVELQNTDFASDIELNFAELGFACPFGTLVALRAIESARLNNLNTFRALNHDRDAAVTNYLAHIGFFEICGIDHHVGTGKRRGSDGYIRLTEISVDVIYLEARNSHVEPGDVLRKYSEELSRVLVQQESGAAFETVAFSLTELFRNVLEHSQSEKLFYLAQYWPGSRSAEIAVSDAGIGIRESLSKNPERQASSDEEALNLAILPKVSGVSKGLQKRQSGKYKNAGFGLYMTSNFCENGGKFYLTSGNSFLRKVGKNIENLPSSMHGTVVGMKLSSLGTQPFEDLKRSAWSNIKEDAGFFQRTLFNRRLR
jgi:hypothetical protein